MGFLAALLPLFTGSLQGLKDWFSYKQQSAKAEQEYKLAVITAQAEAAKQQAISDSSDLDNRLNATTKQFKQTTFWLLYFPVLFTVLFPNKAAVMWSNLGLIPEWFQWLFLSVYSAVWGLPIVKGGYGAIVDLLQARRDFKVEKIKVLNEAKLFDSLRKSIFTGGLTEQQVKAVQEAIKVGMSKDNESNGT